MRIRKSQVPFPLSSQLADPHRISRSSVVVQLNDATTTTTTSPKPSCTHGSAAAPIRSSLDRPQQSDQPLSPIGKPTDGCDGSSGEGGTRRRQQQNKDCLVEDEDWRGQKGGGGHKGNDTRKGCILGSEKPLEAFPPSSPSKQDGRWCEGEKSIPLKKRRGGFHENMQENNSDNDNNIKNKKMNRIKGGMKMKINKEQECSVQVDDIVKEEEADDVDEEKVIIRETKPDGEVSKKRVRGGAVMEGSRCSRVNGRGWRCCQQTLVGYSLCEHHLGKGRLRSMTSVRSRSIATSTATSSTSTSTPKKLHRVPLSKASSSSSSPHEEKETKSIIHHDDPLGNDGEENDETKPVMATKKRMKLGTVKARSMSSLLGQTNIEIAVQENNK